MADLRTWRRFDAAGVSARRCSSTLARSCTSCIARASARLSCSSRRPSSSAGSIRRYERSRMRSSGDERRARHARGGAAPRRLRAGRGGRGAGPTRPTPSRLDTSPCPTCAHPVEPRQLVCLSCGGRVAIDHGSSIVSEPLVPLIVALVVVGAGLFGFAISEITSDSGEARQRRPERRRQRPQVVDGEGRGGTCRAHLHAAGADRPSGRAVEPARLAARRDRAHRRAGHDRRPAGSRRGGEEARSSGLEAGLLPSDPYDLGTGLWIVFSGSLHHPRGAAPRRPSSPSATRAPTRS